METNGVQSVALETAGLPQGFLSGTISAAALPPFSCSRAIGCQAKYMLEVIGLRSSRRCGQETIVGSYFLLSQGGMLRLRPTSVKSKGRCRAENDASVAAMVDADCTFKKVTQKSRPSGVLLSTNRRAIRGKIVPAEMFDEATKGFERYRAAGSKK